MSAPASQGRTGRTLLVLLAVALGLLCAPLVRTPCQLTLSLASRRSSVACHRGALCGLLATGAPWPAAAGRQRVACRAGAEDELRQWLLQAGGAPEAGAAPAGAAPACGGKRPKVVFLGSPQCVNVVLQALWDGANTCAVPFDLCAVVSQPPKPVRNKKDVKTPIHQLAEAMGVDHIMTPDSAKDESFLEALEELAPDVCITAAYGQYLPKRFLRTPKLGTLNLHPSLLPKWRGASPVQRCLEAGEDETGITILYTVTKMDAGPLVVQESTPLTGSETSEEMLDRLFAWGSELLIDDALPRVLRGDVDMESAQTQDEDAVTKASLIRKEEGNLWPHNETAVQMRNKVRAFTGWPGTTLPVAIAMKGETKGVRMRVSGAEVVSASELLETPDGEERSPQALVFMPSKGAVAVRPGSDPDNVLLLKTLQIPSKSEMAAKAFAKGYMKATPVLWMTPEEEAERATASKKGSGKKKPKRTRR